VLAIDKEPWKTIELKGQQITWINNIPENVNVFRYIGQDSRGVFLKALNGAWVLNQKIQNYSLGRFKLFNANSFINRCNFSFGKIDFNLSEIKTNVPDLYSLIGKKTLDAFEACVQEMDFDYIFRTNVSSYVDLQTLNDFIQDKPKENYYAGTLGNHQGIDFASGSGYFISKDLVVKVLKNRGLWDHNLIDDVSLGKLLTKTLQIEIEEVARIDIDSVETVFEKIEASKLGTYHYRCKAVDAFTTIEIMKQIHKSISRA
jgi:hypothetical protein